MAERILYIVRQDADPIKIKNPSLSELEKIIRGRLQRTEKANVLLFFPGKVMKSIDQTKLDQAADLFKNGENPHFLTFGIARQMFDAKKSFVRTFSTSS